MGPAARRERGRRGSVGRGKGGEGGANVFKAKAVDEVTVSAGGGGGGGGGTEQVVEESKFSERCKWRIRFGKRVCLCVCVWVCGCVGVYVCMNAFVSRFQINSHYQYPLLLGGGRVNKTLNPKP